MQTVAIRYGPASAFLRQNCSVRADASAKSMDEARVMHPTICCFCNHMLDMSCVVLYSADLCFAGMDSLNALLLGLSSCAR